MSVESIPRSSTNASPSVKRPELLSPAGDWECARAAVENLTRVLSIEWARFNVRLTALAAGHFATETLRTKYPQAVVDNVAHSVPLGRMGTEEEFAWQVAYLASPAGDYYSGTILTMDGARDNWVGPWPPVSIADAAGKPVAEQRKPKP